MYKKSALFPLILVLILSASPIAAQTPGSFSADMLFSGPNGMSGAGKLFFNGDKVRIEMGAQGRNSIMINDTAKKTSYVLMPEQHMYMEMNTEMMGGQRRGPDWRAYDAANPCANLTDTTCRKVGTETVNGRLCNKWQFTIKGSGERVVWIDQKTGIPVKTQMENGGVLELTNIKEGTQSASLFEIPPGYQKMDMGGMMQRMQRGQGPQ